jgi:hypothetical protein
LAAQPGPTESELLDGDRFDEREQIGEQAIGVDPGGLPNETLRTQAGQQTIGVSGQPDPEKPADRLW